MARGVDHGGRILAHREGRRREVRKELGACLGDVGPQAVGGALVGDAEPIREVDEVPATREPSRQVIDPEGGVVDLPDEVVVGAQPKIAEPEVAVGNEAVLLGTGGKRKLQGSPLRCQPERASLSGSVDLR